MQKYEIRECEVCHEKKRFYGKKNICAACRWWEKHHNGEKRIFPKRIRDGLKTAHRREYNILRGARNRCCNRNNPKYPDYGGRGIKVCDRWMGPYGFHNFYADMGDCPYPEYSLDRIDVDGDYCPENCRWTSPLIQGGNKRTLGKYSSYVGVSYNKHAKLWTSRIQVDKKSVLLYSKTEQEAIRKRRELEKKYSKF